MILLRELMSDTSLTLTAVQPGNYKVNYKKVGYKNFTEKI